MEERVSYLENTMIELQKFVRSEKLARTKHLSSVQELLASEKAAREKHAEELVANYDAYLHLAEEIVEERLANNCVKVADHFELEKQTRAMHGFSIASIEKRVKDLEQLVEPHADVRLGDGEGHDQKMPRGLLPRDRVQVPQPAIDGNRDIYHHQRRGLPEKLEGSARDVQEVRFPQQEAQRHQESRPRDQVGFTRERQRVHGYPRRLLQPRAPAKSTTNMRGPHL